MASTFHLSVENTHLTQGVIREFTSPVENIHHFDIIMGVLLGDEENCTQMDFKDKKKLNGQKGDRNVD